MIIKSNISNNLQDHEELFNKYIDYDFDTFLGDRYNCYPQSLLISYNPHVGEGSATFKHRSGGKTINGSFDSVTLLFKKDKWKVMVE